MGTDFDMMNSPEVAAKHTSVKNDLVESRKKKAKLGKFFSVLAIILAFCSAILATFAIFVYVGTHDVDEDDEYYDDYDAYDKEYDNSWDYDESDSGYGQMDYASKLEAFADETVSTDQNTIQVGNTQIVLLKTTVQDLIDSDVIKDSNECYYSGNYGSIYCEDTFSFYLCFASASDEEIDGTVAEIDDPSTCYIESFTFYNSDVDYISYMGISGPTSIDTLMDIFGEHHLTYSNKSDYSEDYSFDLDSDISVSYYIYKTDSADLGPVEAISISDSSYY